MFELGDDAEAALSYLMRHRPDCSSMEDDILVRGILELKENGMANATTDRGQSAIFTCDSLAAGNAVFNEHQQMRRGCVSLSDSAEELMLWTYADYVYQKKRGGKINFEEVEGRVEDYRELSREGLLDVFWADDRPCVIIGITEKGISYARGDGYGKEAMQINVTTNPSITINATGGNATNSAASSAEVSAEASLVASFDGVIDAIRKSDLGVEDQVAIEKAVRGIDAASREKDAKGLLESIEKTTSIVKNVASVGGPLITFLGKITGSF